MSVGCYLKIIETINLYGRQYIPIQDKRKIGFYKYDVIANRKLDFNEPIHGEEFEPDVTMCHYIRR